MNYRRGFFRIYVLLWGGWVVAVALIPPLYFGHKAFDQYLLSKRVAVEAEVEARQHAREVSKEFATRMEERAEIYLKEWDSWSYPRWFPWLLEEWLFSLLVFIGAPALLFGFLYGAVATVGRMARWVIGGFR